MPPRRTLAFLAPLLEDSYFGTLLSGIEAVTQQHGARLIAIQTSSHCSTATSELPLAWDAVDGWIATLDGLTAEYQAAIRRSGKPGVLLSATLPGLACTTVRADNQAGMAAAVEHLLAHGHTRIAFVGCLDQDDIRQRYAGYEAALAAQGIAPDPALFFAAPDQIEGGGRAAARRLVEHGLPCTAVVAATDLNAVGLLDVLKSAGYRVPDDIAVVGFDNMPLAQFTTPPLTSVHQSFAAIAGRAAEELLGQLAGHAPQAALISVPTTLVQRFSCGCGHTAPDAVEDAPRADHADWHAYLARQLVQIAMQPEPLAQSPAQLWPGVTAVVQALDAALSGSSAPSQAALQAAWQAGFTLARRNVQSFHRMRDCLKRAAETRLSAHPDDGARSRVAAWLEQTRTHQAYAEQRAATDQVLQLEQLLQNSYAVNVALTDTQRDVAGDLGWLRHTSVQRAYLALASETDGGAMAELEHVATYGDTRGELTGRGRRYFPASFPPPEIWAEADDHCAATLTLLPLRTAGHSWGVLALFAPRENRISSGEGRLRQWTTLLSNALERKALLESLAAQHDSLRLAFEREQLLTETIRELGCPVLPLSAHVLLIPLVGAIDSGRAQQFIAAMLEGITVHRARTVLLDITGVPVVDTQVANTLIHATQACTLLGARVVLVGIRPEIAQSIVALGVDLRHMTTAPSLAVALQSVTRPASAYA